MPKLNHIFLSSFLILSCICSPQPQTGNRIDLPNGWHLTPAGHSVSVGDLPLNIAVSPDGNYAAVTNNGESDQSIELIDVKSEKVVDSVRIEKSWLGLQFSDDRNHLFASCGNDNKVIEYSV